MMAWSRRAILIYPVSGLTEQHKDNIAQAFVDNAGLETFANERAMFEKAAPISGDYGATETHRQISTAATPELAAAMTEALVGISGTWYLLDADTDELLATNDVTKTNGKGLDWAGGVGLVQGEVVRYQGALYAVVQQHTSQGDWTPPIARSLFKRYRAPDEVSEWEQPLGSFDSYPIGARVKFNGDVWINTSPDNVWQPGVTGWRNLAVPAVGAWAVGVKYVIGDLVTRAGNTYRCRTAHTGAAHWAPDLPGMTALWQVV